jgi:hypothetical protein
MDEVMTGGDKSVALAQRQGGCGAAAAAAALLCGSSADEGRGVPV